MSATSRTPRCAGSHGVVDVVGAGERDRSLDLAGGREDVLVHAAAARGAPFVADVQVHRRARCDRSLTAPPPRSSQAIDLESKPLDLTTFSWSCQPHGMPQTSSTCPARSPSSPAARAASASSTPRRWPKPAPRSWSPTSTPTRPTRPPSDARDEGPSRWPASASTCARQSRPTAMAAGRRRRLRRHRHPGQQRGDHGRPPALRARQHPRR